MGLDMYLKAEKYVGGWDHGTEIEKMAYKAILLQVGLPECEGSPWLEVSATVAYWRKANQIHSWFVREVQNGKDECEPHQVSREQLQELLDLCRRVKKTKDPSLLEPVGGFFFGSTDIDEWYWQDIDLTIKQLRKVLALPDQRLTFIYQSSW